MKIRFHLLIGALALLMIGSAVITGQPAPRTLPPKPIPQLTLLNIIRHEDERRWDDQLKALLTDSDPKVRARAALAAGRIGDEKAVPTLADAVLTDRDNAVREMAAFALGEI